MFASDKKTWTDADIKTLISLYENMSHLWDVKSPNYRNRAKKQVTVRKIASALGTTSDEIARKLHNLRSQYMQEKKKKIKTTAWPYFTLLKFIDGSVERLENADASRSTDNLILPAEEQNTGEQVEETQIKIQEEQQQQQQRKRKRYIRDETRLSVENELQTTSTNHISYDEEQIFGNYVASELRDLKNPENKRKLRRLINQAIMEISDLEHGNSYSPSMASSSEASHAIFIPSNPLSPSEEPGEYTKQEEDDSNFSYM